MRLLDRYVLNNFLLPFCYCFFGFLAIWLVFDLTDNGPDFIDNHVPLWKIAFFYSTQFPQIIVISLPVGLLLALLYSLSRMSRSNEIISMLTAGRSLMRIVLPLFAAGLVITGASMGMNYKLAPHSEALKKKILYEISHTRNEQQEMDTILFKNRTDNRIWYVQKINVKRNEMEGIEIIQYSHSGDTMRKYYAKAAEFDPATKTWTLEKGRLVNFDRQGNVTTEESWLNGTRLEASWSETPWRISSSELDPQDLSVPELEDYLKYNADFPDAGLAPYRTNLGYRWALPWQCFIVVLFAAPLGIVYSRRGVLGGVLYSILIFFGMLFLTNLGLALGKWSHISPFSATWGPDILFAFLGVILIYVRSNNIEIPTLKALLKRKAS